MCPAGTVGHMAAPRLTSHRFACSPRVVVATAFAVGLVLIGSGCGGDDDAGGVAVVADAADSGSQEGGRDGGYAIGDDYPLPAPEGGTLQSTLFDEMAGTSRVVIAYPSSMLDSLIQTYDDFFDTVEGETIRVPLTDGIASWQNDTAGYSVVVNGQNLDVQVALQTGF